MTVRDFPEKMHQSFAALVAAAVTRKALAANEDTLDYILSLYGGAEDPPEFRGSRRLERLGRLYGPLVKATLCEHTLPAAMNPADATYLCYRLYLHSLSVHILRTDADAVRNRLKLALRGFWLSKGRTLTLPAEKALVEMLDDYSSEAGTGNSEPGTASCR